MFQTSLKFFLSSLVIVLGVVFTAPHALAWSDDVPVDVQTLLDRCVLETGWVENECQYFYVSYEWNDNINYYAVLINSNTVDYVDFQVNSNGSNGNFGTNAIYYDYINLSVSNFAVNGTEYGYMYNYTGTYGFGNFPFNVYTSFDADVFHCNEPSKIVINRLVDTVNQTNFTSVKPVLTSYLDVHSWEITGAYLAENNDNSFSQVLPLNVVLNPNSLPADFEGLYCLVEKKDWYYRCSVALTAGSDPNDYSDYWDTYLIVVFAPSDLTNFTCYLGYSFDNSPHDLAFKFGSNSWLSGSSLRAVPYNIFNYHFYGCAVGSAFAESSSPLMYCGIKWRNMSLSAISKPEISPLIVAFDYSNTVNGTVTDGNGSSDYNNYETNYFNTVYQNSISGLTGSFSSSSFTGASVPADFEVNLSPDYDFSSLSNLLSVLLNPFVLTLVIASITIGIIGYILYGKN